MIEKARDVVANFAGVLPNFFCQQVTTRYQTEHPRQGWDALDVVTADVAYEDGRESYKNIKVGNRPVSQNMEDLEGTRSTGEFASLEIDLLNPGTAASFRRTGQETIHGRQTWVYKFEVPRERSHWRVEVAAQIYYPAYQGTVWIDKETSRLSCESSNRRATCHCCFRLTQWRRQPTTILCVWLPRIRFCSQWMPRYSVVSAAPATVRRTASSFETTASSELSLA